MEAMPFGLILNACGEKIKEDHGYARIKEKKTRIIRMCFRPVQQFSVPSVTSVAIFIFFLCFLLSPVLQLVHDE